MKKVIKFLVGLSFGFLLFYFIIQKAGKQTLEKAFLIFWSWEGLILIFLTLLIAFVSIARWRLTLSCQGEKKTVDDLSGIWFIGFLVSYLTPVSLLGGEAVRMYLTGKLLNIDWQKGCSSVIIDKLLDVTFHVLFVIVGIVVFLIIGNFPKPGIFWTAIIAILFLGIALAFFYSRAINKKSILLLVLKLLGLKKTEVKATKNGEFIFHTEGNVLRFFSPSQKFFWKGMALSFLRHILVYFRVFLLVFFLVGSIEPIKTLAIQGLAYLSFFLPLPAGLGGLEAIISLGFSALGFNFVAGTIFGITWRGLDLVLCLLGIIVGLKLGFKLFQMRLFNFADKVSKKY